MALVFSHRRHVKGYDANGWLAVMFRADEQAEIRQRAGTAVQMRLPMV
jgi:hypothetical protein